MICPCRRGLFFAHIAEGFSLRRMRVTSAHMNALTPQDDFAVLSADNRDIDPAGLVWSPMLPIELALKTATPQELREAYGYTDAQWDALRHHPLFLKELTDACETVRQEGMGFKLKAKLQAEELLKTSWKLIHGGDAVPPSVKADLIKATMRWAGYEQKDAAAGSSVPALAIQINL